MCDIEAHIPADLAPTTKADLLSVGDLGSVVDVYEKDEKHEKHDPAPFWAEAYHGKPWSITQLLPPLAWVPSYIRTVRGRQTDADGQAMGLLEYSIKGDLIAGLTVGFMLVPQCLAFALLAGLPLQTGLYASFAPLVAYSFLGTIRQVQPGPTALMSLLTGQALDAMDLKTDGERIAGAAFLALMVGAMSLVLGAIRVGFIVDFMSHSVMNAFCSAAGVTIATSQLKHLLGIEMSRKKYWWKTASYLVLHIDETNGYTIALGGTLLFLLLSLKSWKTAGTAAKRREHLIWRFFPTDKNSKSFKALKLVADLSSLLSVVVGWLWGLAYREAGVDSVSLVGEVDSDGFVFAIPGEGHMSKIDLASLLPTAAIMTVVGFLETVAVGGKFAMQARYEYDPNQELLALGVANVAGAMMAGYPTTGSFSRTAVNAMFGATSLLACGLSAVVVFLAVYLILPVIAKLPLASLAPIIIQGAIGVINLHEFTVAFKSSLSEFLVMLSTFVVSLALSVKEGLAVGFVLSILKTMHELANPNMAVLGRVKDQYTFRDVRNFPQSHQLKNAVLVRMDARLNFVNSRKLKEFCMRALRLRSQSGDKIKFIVIDAKAINNIDLTGVEMLERLAEDLHENGQSLVIANLKAPVLRVFTASELPPKLKKMSCYICTDMYQAVAIIEGLDPNGSSAALEWREIIKCQDEAKLYLQNQQHHHNPQ
eukprot:CAMPEP_0178374306 /NCGR_PEP_ID=MMETSP0689_2-20121128/2308_1 /TAXON_ID=160604 /ORGANISM="Amphidinium massartii, Strain CS-259" /LENGTH=706 /DNA_ID=CAMNT_0019994271 /DNA_START=140 /DNA_END=2257 /DNA_ORIENTATION=+